MVKPKKPDPSSVLSYAKLKAKHRAERHAFNDGLKLRTHRALSWLERAEQLPDDPDLRFIVLWIGFNAAYAADIGRDSEGEREKFQLFFQTLVWLDKEDRIYKAIWERFAHEVRVLLANQFTFEPFWKHQGGCAGYDDWQDRLDKSQRAINAAVAAKDTPVILSVLFQRIYVLRNQLMHGASTWNSQVNRAQVKDCAAVLGFLLPLFIDLMMDHPEHNWGSAYFPVVN